MSFILQDKNVHGLYTAQRYLTLLGCQMAHQETCTHAWAYVRAWSHRAEGEPTQSELSCELSLSVAAALQHIHRGWVDRWVVSK